VSGAGHEARASIGPAGEGFGSGPRIVIGSPWSLTESGRMGRFPMTSDLAFRNHVALR
jgi:hypothetical protein